MKRSNLLKTKFKDNSNIKQVKNKSIVLNYVSNELLEIDNFNLDRNINLNFNKNKNFEIITNNQEDISRLKT